MSPFLRAAAACGLLLIPLGLRAANWTWQNPLPQGNDIFDVKAMVSTTPPETTLVAVGDIGVVMQSRNLGSTWTISQRVGGFGGALRSVVLPFAQATIIAVGDSGVVLKTTDAGATWTRRRLGNGSIGLNAVKFFDMQTGIVVGDSGRIYTTTDQGTTWILRSSNSLLRLNGLHLRAGTAWACGDGGLVVKSLDRGITWSLLQNSSTRNLLATFFKSDSVGWCVGEAGTILRSVNGGRTWLGQTSHTVQTLTSISFPPFLSPQDTLRGTIAGGSTSGGVLVETTDGGASWNVSSVSVELGLHSIYYFNRFIGWYAGDAGRMAVTRTGAGGWSSLSSGAVPDLFSVSILDSLTLIAVGQDGAVLRSSSGGNNWQTQSSGTSRRLAAVSFVPEVGLGWAVGDSGAVIRSTDEGVTWDVIPPPVPGHLYAVKTRLGTGPLPNRVIAVGERGTIIRTTNDGATWDVQTPDLSITLLAVDMIDDQYAWAAGTNGRMFRTVDGGTVWQSSFTGATLPLFSISFATRDVGWVVGQTGQILKTTDGGVTWVNQSSNSPARSANLVGVSFVDTLNGYIVGQNGVFLRTADGGNSWHLTPHPSEYFLHSVQFATPDLGWMVGERGAILQTRNGGGPIPPPPPPPIPPGLSDTSYAVFPNPSGSRLVLGGRAYFPFRISATGRVTIELINVLGQRLVTLMDEERTPGDTPCAECSTCSANREIDCASINTTTLPSGVYFVRMLANGRQFVRKLIILH